MENLSAEAKIFKDLNIGVIGEIEKIETELLSNSTTWAAALENELFSLSNNKILYTDLLEFN